MPTNTRMTSVRRAAALAAPLAVAALALTACNPTHITDMNSPTPSGSNLASPYAPSAEAEPEHTASSAPAATGAAAFFVSEDGQNYALTSLTVDGTKVEPGSFSGLAVLGNPTDGVALSTLGLCDGALYSATGSGTTVTSSAGDAWNTDKCSVAAEEAVATKVHSVLEGKLTVTASGETFTLKGAKGELVLTPAN